MEQDRVTFDTEELDKQGWTRRFYDLRTGPPQFPIGTSGILLGSPPKQPTSTEFLIYVVNKFDKIEYIELDGRPSSLQSWKEKHRDAITVEGTETIVALYRRSNMSYTISDMPPEIF